MRGGGRETELELRGEGGLREELLLSYMYSF